MQISTAITVAETVDVKLIVIMVLFLLLFLFFFFPLFSSDFPHKQSLLSYIFEAFELAEPEAALTFPPSCGSSVYP